MPGSVYGIQNPIRNQSPRDSGMAVEFDRTIEVSTAPTDVWNRILEIDCIAGWVPIIGDVEEIERLVEYEAVLSDALGPFSMAADLEITVLEHAEPNHIRFKADGEDRQVGSRILVDATLDLAPTNAGSELRFHGSYEVSGRAATLGASMIRTKASAMIDKFEAGARTEFG